MAETGAHGAEHLPFFITAPGQPDVLFNFTVVFIVVLLLLIGNLYLQLHSVPDRMAHKANNAQLQLIGILTLLALFTHNNLYWVAAIVLAAINLPDFVTPLTSIARSLRRLSGRDHEEDDTVRATEDKSISEAFAEAREEVAAERAAEKAAERAARREGPGHA